MESQGRSNSTRQHTKAVSGNKNQRWKSTNQFGEIWYLYIESSNPLIYLFKILIFYVIGYNIPYAGFMSFLIYYYFIILYATINRILFIADRDIKSVSALIFNPEIWQIWLIHPVAFLVKSLLISTCAVMENFVFLSFFPSHLYSFYSWLDYNS